MKKKLLLSLAVIFLMSGCGGDTGGKAQLDDSPVSGVSYKTQTYSGLTDDGYFKYAPTDKNVTFSVGKVIIGTFALNKLNADKKVLPADLAGVNRNITDSPDILKIIQFLQSLDSDGNPNNGIDINSSVRDRLDNLNIADDNLLDNNITEIKRMVKDAGCKFIDAGTARRNYELTLKDLNITPVFAPFITQWKVPADGNVTFDADSAYEYNYTVNWGDGDISKDVTAAITHTYTNAGEYNITITGEFPHFVSPTITELQKIWQWGDIDWKSFNSAFKNDSNLTLTIPALDTPDLNDVMDMRCAFENDVKINPPVISEWNVSNVTNMFRMFNGATSFNQPLNDWNVSKVATMLSMFNGATSFNQPLNDWNVSKVTDMNGMFQGAVSFNQPLNNWNVSKVTDMNGMFYGAVDFDGNISNWNVSNVIDMRNMFYNATSFNQPLNDWNISRVQYISGMFQGAVSFNQPLNDWNVSNIKDMTFMFYKAASFDGNISGWNVSNVVWMIGMFYGATSFNQSLNNWNVSNVTNMLSMFQGAVSFNQPLNKWNVSKVQNMNYMFAGAVSFDGNISDWNVSNVQYMDHMFDGATSFSYQDLSGWKFNSTPSHTDYNISTGPGNIWPAF